MLCLVIEWLSSSGEIRLAEIVYMYVCVCVIMCCVVCMCVCNYVNVCLCECMYLYTCVSAQ